MTTQFRLEELLDLNKLKLIPDEKGIYIIRKPKDMNVSFSEFTTAIDEFQGKSMLYHSDKLLTKFEKSDKEILYIGKAGGKVNKLKKRIGQFIKYGDKSVKNHCGGRAIWQINNNRDLLLEFILCDNPEEEEKDLLSKYREEHKVLPVANWRVG